MKKISLVLSGGGARGLAHVGVLEELEKQGCSIHAIAGTSMGAVVGGIYAAGKMDEFKEWLLSLDKVDIFNLVDFTLFDSGFIKGDRVFEKLSAIIPDNQIQDLPIRFVATATELMSRKEVIFTKGSLYNAMRASVAIPNVITPVKSEDSVFVDGGVVNNMPLNHARRIDHDRLVAVNVNADMPVPEKQPDEAAAVKPSFYQKTLDKFNQHLSELFPDQKNNELSYFDILNVSFELMRDEMVKLSLKNTPPDVLIEISRYSCEMYDFYKAEELIEMGREATRKRLKDNGSL